MDNIEEKLDYYMNLDWSLNLGTDLDFEGKPYHYVEIKEFPNFAFCAKTQEIALANYKKQLRLTIKVMLEFGDEIPKPGDFDDDVDWESLCP